MLVWQTPLVTRYRQFAKLKIQLSNRYVWKKLQIKSDCGNFVQLLQNENFLTQQLTFYSCCSQKYVVQLVEPAYRQLAERNFIYCVAKIRISKKPGRWLEARAVFHVWCLVSPGLQPLGANGWLAGYEILITDKFLTGWELCTGTFLT